jgi:hypothetical protein
VATIVDGSLAAGHGIMIWIGFLGHVADETGIVIKPKAVTQTIVRITHFFSIQHLHWDKINLNHRASFKNLQNELILFTKLMDVLPNNL